MAAKKETSPEEQPATEPYEGLRKADFQRVMDELQASNPAKFEAQKDDLQKQMDAAPE